MITELKKGFFHELASFAGPSLLTDPVGYPLTLAFVTASPKFVLKSVPGP